MIRPTKRSRDFCSPPCRPTGIKSINPNVSAAAAAAAVITLPPFRRQTRVGGRGRNRYNTSVNNLWTLRRRARSDGKTTHTHTLYPALFSAPPPPTRSSRRRRVIYHAALQQQLSTLPTSAVRIQSILHPLTPENFVDDGSRRAWGGGRRNRKKTQSPSPLPQGARFVRRVLRSRFGRLLRDSKCRARACTIVFEQRQNLQTIFFSSYRTRAPPPHG